MTRKTTPQSLPKLGKNPRDREKELEEERWWDEERESFPEYWYVVNGPSRLTIFIPSLPLPSQDFRFHPLALSPDMQGDRCHPNWPASVRAVIKKRGKRRVDLIQSPGEMPFLHITPSARV
jgi:hypothetical protein